MRALLLGSLSLALAACASVERPTPEQLGNRVRVRVAGREIPSITSGDYMVFFTVITPEGERQRFRIRAVESVGAEGLSLVVSTTVEMRNGNVELELVPSLHAEGADLVPDLEPRATQTADVVMLDGYALDFSPGSFFAYRIDEDNKMMAADLAPEIVLGQLTKDGSRYVELTPSAGPEMAVSGRPPGFEVR